MSNKSSVGSRPRQTVLDGDRNVGKDGREGRTGCVGSGNGGESGSKYGFLPIRLSRPRTLIGQAKA